jgi:hypothetical protein
VFLLFPWNWKLAFFWFWFLSCFSAGQIVPDPASDKDEYPEILTDPESEDEDPASEEDENPEFLADPVFLANPALEEDEVDPAIGADPDSEDEDPEIGAGPVTEEDRAIGAEPEDYSLTTYEVVLVLQ